MGPCSSPNRIAHTPPEVLAKNTRLDKECLRPNAPERRSTSSPAPCPVLWSRIKPTSAAAVASKYQYTFHMKVDGADHLNNAGEARIVDSHNFPVSKKIAAAWSSSNRDACANCIGIPRTSEWQYYIAGKGRMTVYFPVSNARTMDYNANDVGYVPSNAPHYIENTGDTDLVFLETFASDVFLDVSLNQWLRRVPSEILKAHLNIDKATAMTIPSDKLELV